MICLKRRDRYLYGVNIWHHLCWSQLACTFWYESGYLVSTITKRRRWSIYSPPSFPHSHPLTHLLTAHQSPGFTRGWERWLYSCRGSGAPSRAASQDPPPHHPWHNCTRGHCHHGEPTCHLNRRPKPRRFLPCWGKGLVHCTLKEGWRWNYTGCANLFLFAHTASIQYTVS